MNTTLRTMSRSILISLIGVFLCVFVYQQMSVAAWSSHSQENTAICTASGQQSSPQIIDDGVGGAIIAWEDARDIHFDIYVQRIDAQGNALWQKDGVPVCAAPENQKRPRMVSDGDGGAIIVWHDMRSGIGNYDVYAQRIDAKGNTLWMKDGIPVCSEVKDQDSPCITSDGVGGAIIVWEDFRTNYADLYGQRINKNGETLWAKNGVLVCGVSGAQNAPEIVSDGTGGAIVVWQDFRRNYADIYAQRLDASGTMLWDKFGIAVCTAQGHESFAVAVSNGAEGAIITWVDTRNGTNNNDIFAQQIDGNGAVQWLLNGIPLCTAPGNQNYPVITTDGAGGAISAWWDMRSGDFNIFAQRIDISGCVQWEDNGTAICIESGIQNRVSIVSDNNCGAILAWNDNRGFPADFDVYAQRIDRKGMPLWKKNGVAISTASDTQCFPVLVGDGTGGAIITWQDGRQKDKNYWDLYAQKINNDGL
ncbi:hypothetical protein BIY37_04855 [Candidatus Brocadia sapporoensis]|uniref:Bulb-type lectin domain-containing protein n=1 Tax=Candidatus Brocadia sapporoensis TaxID=392547 RepID=A0A1V6M165_9BACT|nr:hypothetical protein [Candidatus Brocadia sapporoensis]MDG6005564.1 hypothetical protein [Candidatus Brocadia sp.]OQD46154.1 hypothetical protein BIY37_04855 [Candidatus Brocadia sapporoensis]